MRKLMVMAAVVAVAGAAVAAVTAQDYVQDGLIAHWDAIDNAGTGTHVSNATTWKNLVTGGMDLTLGSGGSWLDGNALKSSGSALAARGPTTIVYKSMEILFANERSSSSIWLFGSGGSRYCAVGANATMWYNKRGITTFTRSKIGTYSLSWVNDQAAYIDGIATTYGDYNDTWGYGPAYVTLGMRDTSYGFKGKYHAIRLYNRALTAAEVAYNRAVDAERFLSIGPHTWTGASGGDWAAVSNWDVNGSAATCAPGVTTIVSVASSTISVNADATVARIELDTTAKLSIASGCAVGAFVVTRNGVAVPRGIYTGTGAGGTQVDWLEGEGVLRVAGGKFGIPTRFPTPTGDGWYEFGIASGGSYGYNGTKDTPHAGQHYIVGDHPIWDDYAFPAGAKLRLVGYILLETVPAGLFSAYDVSGTTRVYVNGTQAFADGTKFAIPKGCTFRCQPYRWVLDDSVANKWWCTAATGNPLTYTDDIENNGTHTVYGDGTQTAQQIFSGQITGNGELYVGSFSKQARLTGGYSANLKMSVTSNGQAVWLDTTAVTGVFSTASLFDCKVTGNNGKYGTNTSYCASAILLGKDNSEATADHELTIGTLTGNANDTTDIPSGIRWRHGGHAIVWGNNTLHVGELKNGLHVVARRQDQRCTNGWMGNAACKGIGNLVVDTFTSGNLYPSTNINVKIGKVVAASKFDYTYQSGAINGMTLDITNTCNSGAIVKATDIGMLPARLSGFKGTVTLTDTATKSYTMPIDFTHGTNTLYNTTGCIGSGTLGSAPASGTIDATFPTTGDTPVKGEYALARFTSGGGLLADWTVTLNGQSVDSAIVSGMKVSVVKDATGLWLKVDKPGVAFIIR